MVNLRLIGTTDSRDAIGASVTCVQGDVRRTLPLLAGDGFYSANERSLHFGLGKIDTSQTVQIKIRWPGGDEQTAEAMAGGDYLIVQGIASAHRVR